MEMYKAIRKQMPHPEPADIIAFRRYWNQVTMITAERNAMRNENMYYTGCTDDAIDTYPIICSSDYTVHSSFPCNRCALQRELINDLPYWLW